MTSPERTPPRGPQFRLPPKQKALVPKQDLSALLAQAQHSEMFMQMLTEVAKKHGPLEMPNEPTCEPGDAFAVEPNGEGVPHLVFKTAEEMEAIRKAAEESGPKIVMPGGDE